MARDEYTTIRRNLRGQGRRRQGKPRPCKKHGPKTVPLQVLEDVGDFLASFLGVVDKAANFTILFYPSVLVHGGGLDGLDALVDGGGFLGAAEATKRLGLALQDGHNLKTAFAELLSQNGEELAVARL